LTKGDVEVHVRSSDWYSHGHHADADYNNVILHVVLWHDSSVATLLKSGRRIPVLCLSQALRHQAYLLPCQLPCSRILDRLDGQTLRKLLKAAGEERFKQKAIRFHADLEKEEAGQVLFRGMMRALGYAKNTKPFEDLADKMPLSSLESREGFIEKQALLLGTAGLLPSQRCQPEFVREEEVEELERIWESESKNVEPLKESDWNLSRIYPINSPVRRIVAQAYLLERYCDGKLLTRILWLVREAPLLHAHRKLEDGLTVASDGYWLYHFDFGVRSKTKISALLGNNKAGELVVNTVLPFAFSWGELSNEPKLTENAIELYCSHPRLADNWLTRHMLKQLCLEDLSDFRACHQQGLIHIFRNYCREGRCGECPLGSRVSVP